MSKPLSEQELEELFKTNLPPVHIPADLAMRLEARVLAEVAVTFHEDAAAEGNRQARVLRPRWLNALADWPVRLGRGASLTLTGAAVAVMLLFVLMLPRLLAPQSSESITGQSVEELLPPATLPAAATARITTDGGDVLIQRGSTGLVESLDAGEEGLLGEGDIVQANSGSAEIEFFPDQRAMLEPFTRIRLVELQGEDDKTHVVLLQESGATHHSILQSLAADDRYEVRTTAMRATVLGTEFSVIVRSVEETAIQTVAGVVYIETDAGRMEVTAGQSVVARSGSEPFVEVVDPATSPADQLPASDGSTPDERSAQLALLPTPTPSAEAPRSTVTGGMPEEDNRTAPAETESDPGTAVAGANAGEATPSGRTAGVTQPTRTPTPLADGANTPAGTPDSNRDDDAGSATTGTRTPTATPRPTTAAGNPTVQPTATGSATPSRTPVATRTATRPPAASPTVNPTVTATARPGATQTATPVVTATSAGNATPTDNGVENTPPMAIADNATTREDQSVTISVLTNDYDADQDILVVTGVAQAEHGRVVNNGNGTIRYEPNPDFAGSDSFSYRISDGQAIRSAAVTVSVAPVNDPPVLSPIGEQRLNEDGTATFTLIVDDIDTDPAAIAVTAQSSNPDLLPPAGIALDRAENEWRVTLRPVAQGSGSATVTLTARDGQAEASIAFPVTVAPVNDLPTIAPISDQVVMEDGVLEIPVTIGDSDTYLSDLVVEATVVDPALLAPGGVTITGQGETRVVRIVPAPNRHGVTSMKIAVTDGAGRAETSFALTITPVNDPPTIAGPGDQTTNEDQPLEVSVTLSDPDLDTLTLTASGDNPTLLPPAGLTVAGAGPIQTVVITPAPDQSGSARITLTASDGERTSETTFVVTVAPANDPPTISAPESISFAEDTVGEVAIRISDIDNDPAGLRLTATSSDGRLLPEGALQVGGAGADRTLRIAPAANANGTADVVLTVDDGAAQSRRTLRVVVSSVNDAPSLAPLAGLEMNEDERREITLTVNDVDQEAQFLQVTAAASNGELFPPSALQIQGEGGQRTLVLAPAPDRSGSATITVTVSDGERQAEQRFDVTVLPVNDPPGTSDDAANAGGESIFIPALDNDTDDDRSTLRLVQVGTPANGTATIEGNGIRYTAEVDFSGTDVFTYTISDGEFSAVGQIVVTVE